MQEEKRKRCFKCGETKPLSNFHKHPKMADGHVNKCKTCNNRDVRVNRKKNIDHYAAYDKKRASDKLSQREIAKKDRQKCITRSAEKNPDYPNIDKDVSKQATTTVGNATRDGKLKREMHCFCCGSDAHVHAHHSSYDEDMWLFVTWLCASCHSRLHKDFEYFTGPFKRGIYSGFM